VIAVKIKSKNSVAFGFHEADGVPLHRIAKLNGYAVGDRLLEDVFFTCEVDDDGYLILSTHHESALYMKGLNEKRWLKEMFKYIFEGGDDTLVDFETGQIDLIVEWRNDASFSKEASKYQFIY